jgi:hypothetical protein
LPQPDILPWSYAAFQRISTEQYRPHWFTDPASLFGYSLAVFPFGQAGEKVWFLDGVLS